MSEYRKVSHTAALPDFFKIRFRGLPQLIGTLFVGMPLCPKPLFWHAIKREISNFLMDAHF